MRTTKENKIKQIKIISQELERGLISAVEAGADRDDFTEIHVFDMFTTAVEVLERKINEALRDKELNQALAPALVPKRNTKLDN